MPEVTSENLQRLRCSHHSTRLFLAVYRPDVVWTGIVDSGAFPEAMTVPYTGGSAWGDEQQHYAVRVGTYTGGMDKGVARYIDHATGTLDVASNQIAWASGDYLTMVKEIKPDACLPFIYDNTILEDGWFSYGDVYITGEQELRPYANFGPPACIFEGEAVQFYSRSCHVFPLSCQVTGYRWYFDGGVTVTGATGFYGLGATGARSSGDPLVVDYMSAGMYYPWLEVGDSCEMSMRGYRPVMVFGREDDQPYRDFRVSQVQGSLSSRGWSCSIEVFGDADIEQFPEMALVVLFAEDQYDDEEVSIGGDYCYRGNIVFVGYIQRDTVRYEPSQGTVQFEVVGIPRLMNDLTVWPANLVSTGSVGWHKIEGMNFDAAARHIFGEHTTIDHICDIYPTRDTKSLVTVDLSEASVLNQLDRQLYSAIGARVAGNRQGMLYCEHDPQLLSSADRAAIGETMVVQPDDLALSVNLQTEYHTDRACQVVLSGFGYDAADDLVGYEAIYPRNQSSFGSVRKVSGVRVETQEDANELAELIWLRENLQFEGIGLSLGGNYRVFDIAPAEYLRVPVHAADNPRGIRWNNVKLLPTEVSLSFSENGIVRSSLRAERDTLEAAGIVGDHPALYDLAELLMPGGDEDYGVTGPPECDFDAYPVLGIGSTLQVQFYDRSRGCSPTDWEWNFGDGSPTGTEQNPSHEYTGPAPTAYDVKMTVGNEYGTCSVTKSGLIELVAERPAFEKLSTLNASAGENAFECADMAHASGYAYFGTYTSPGQVVKVDVSGVPSRIGAVTLNAGENLLMSCAVASDNVCGYFCTLTSPTIVVKVNLATMARVEALTLNAGENQGYACVLDSNNRYLYVGCNTSPAIIVKVDVGANPLVNNLSRIGAVTLNAGENGQGALAAINSGDTHTYWGMMTNPGRLVDVEISPAFARDDGILCAPGEYMLPAVVIDDNDEYVYASTYYGRQVVKFRIAGFLRIGSIRLDTGDQYLETLLYDDVGDHVFAASVTVPGRVIKVDITDMSRVGHALAAAADGAIACGVIDPTNGYMYFGTLSSPGRILRFGTGN